jgi:hypothetical protein
VGEGLGFWRGRRGSDGSGGRRDRAGFWCEEEADRWVPPISGWVMTGASLLGMGGKRAVGRFLAWAKSVPAALLFFCPFLFSFSEFLF